LTDADLVRGAQRGDAEAWRRLYARYLPAVWRQAYALVSDVHAAEDIASEAMLTLLQNLDRLETEVARLGGWLRGVVRHKAADHQRKLIRSRNLLTPEKAGHNGCAAASPLAPMEAQESRDQVGRVLDRLTDRERIVLEWKYVDSLGVRDIAIRLGETEKAVESSLYRARREFRRLFEQDSAPGGPALATRGQVDTNHKS
jgi:RNA polymerase sigma-70 factor (ECF subfamily)